MKKILVPTSGAVTAQESAEYAMRVASNIKAEVHVLHVVTSDEEVETLPDSLEVFEAASKAADVQVTLLTTVGKVVDQIIEYAESHDINLILMGASNGTVVEKWLSHDVLGQTAVPVLVMPYQLFDSDEENAGDSVDIAAGP